MHILVSYFAVLNLLVHLYGHMHVIPLITIASIFAILLPTYHIYLYRSPDVYFLKMILTQQLNQSGISSQSPGCRCQYWCQYGQRPSHSSTRRLGLLKQGVAIFTINYKQFECKEIPAYSGDLNPKQLNAWHHINIYSI